ncbi:MAG: hypothetical protein AB7F86_08085 [Bdellovibrionales bacterium]
MKALVLVLGLAGQLAWGASHPVPKGTQYLTDVSATVQSTSELCPQDVVCIANGTIVNMHVDGIGCVDPLMPVTYQVIDEHNVAVHLQIAQNERSTRVFCKKIPEFQPKLQLINYYKPFNIHFLGTGQVVEVK